jgi:methylthioribose-1-phosphate isomerase
LHYISLTAHELPRSIEWRNGSLYLLDQTLLPQKTVMEEQLSIEQVWQSIYALKVRGAPAIGVAAAYGLCIAAKDVENLQPGEFIRIIKGKAEYLNNVRPTAVNLSWAMRRMIKCIDGRDGCSTKVLYNRLVTEAELIHEEDRNLCFGIGKTGASLIKNGMGIMTHCNAGALATSELGTATAPMYVAQSMGMTFKVFANETRPLLQGARLTSWELQKSGIDVTLLTDNMAAHMMAQGNIDMVIVGTDRVVANGDVANKIGTLGVAILAKYYNIPFYVACPSSTIDLNIAHGKDIPIEERADHEVTQIGKQKIAPKNIKTRNPAFDVTPNELVTGIITENKIIRAPFEHGLKEFIKEKEQNDG